MSRREPWVSYLGSKHRLATMKRNFLLLVPRLSQSSHSSWLKASLLTLAALNNRTCVAFVNESRGVGRDFLARCRRFQRLPPGLPSTVARFSRRCVCRGKKGLSFPKERKRNCCRAEKKERSWMKEKNQRRRRRRRKARPSRERKDFEWRAVFLR